MAGANHATIPLWTWIAPALASLMLALKFTGVLPAEAPVVLLLAACCCSRPSSPASTMPKSSR